MEENTFNFNDNFNYNTLSGLGESNYENEDLFKDTTPSVENNLNSNVEDDYSNNEFSDNFSFAPGFEGETNTQRFESNNDNNIDKKIDDSFWFSNVNMDNSNADSIDSELQNETSDSLNNEMMNTPEIDSLPNENSHSELTNEDFNNTNNEVIESITENNNELNNDSTELEVNNDFENNVDNDVQENELEELDVPNDELDSDLEQNSEKTETYEEPNEEVKEENQSDEAEKQDTLSEIEISDTPIEELQDLTNYEKEDIEETNIGGLFDKVSVNVKEASDIFRKNTDMKEKIDKRFQELKELQNELESKRQNQINEINAYRDEVFTKLTEKKEEVEKRLNMLKEMQSDLEKERKEFEEYKKNENSKIEDIKNEVQSSYDERREELNDIEELLRKQKDELDQERNQLSLDRIQYEADKNELANNLLKFNELVDTFTNGVNDVKNEE